MKKRHLIWLNFIWISGAIISFAWNYSLIISNNNKVVLIKSRAFFEQLLVTRRWNTRHGGVYVPTTETSPPNPYLKDSLRDIVSTDGMQLTKINPAYMTRQISELNKSESNIFFHITSLNPIRPANRADDWETKALKLFEQGTPEILELIKNDSIHRYRYMAPLITEKECLKCHAKQGYKYGDIRGGISISFPSSLYLKGINSQLFSLGMVHVLILFFGIIGLWRYYTLNKKYFLIIKIKNMELENINAKKDKLFSIISHDLSGPLHTLSGMLKLAKDNLIAEDDFKKFILELSQNVDANRQLLSNLLSWSINQLKTDAVKGKLFCINDLINKNLILFEKLAMSKDISLVFDEDKQRTVFADKDMIDLVVRNLISNALKYTHQHGNIHVSFTESKKEVIVHIIDDGEGIPENDIDKIFGQVMYSTLGTNNEQGTGLGLKLCSEFVVKNNGKINVESINGKGSDFYFSIPKNDNSLI